MNFENRNTQYSFDHYDLPTGKLTVFERLLGPQIGSKITTPVLATVALLLTGAAFAAIIVSSYPSSDSPEAQAPVVSAEASPYKENPAEPGGMAIANQGTTIFQSIDPSNVPEPAPIENLLAEEAPVDRLAAFARQAESAPATTPVATSAANTSAEAPLQKIVETPPEQELASVAPELRPQAEAAPDIPDPVAPVMAPGGGPALAPAQVVTMPDAPLADASVAPAGERPAMAHKPGENPETLEFVRSVLERKDGQASAPAASVSAAQDLAASAAVAQAPAPVMPSESVAAVEPASGGPAKPGSYYVQLASVTSETAAAKEWAKLQKSFGSQLSGLSYRVQKAELGERGTYFRIQAGPVSKDSAQSVCQSIQVQKPGGCLVTK